MRMLKMLTILTQLVTF